MAEKKVIDIVVNTNINKVEKDVNKLSGSLKDATVSSQEFNETADETSSKAAGFKDLASNVVNLVPGLKGATGAADGLLKKMWLLVANPVGLVITAIVVALKFLYESFQASVKGGKELEAMWAGISGVASQVKDAIFGLGRAFINVADAAWKFITLDFDGAAKSMKKANELATQSYNQLKKAVDGTTFSIFQNLEKQQQAVNKARKNLAVTQSETDKLLVQSREILTDETASLKDKKKALEEVTKAEKASSAEKLRIAKEDLRIANAKAKALGGEAEKKMKQELRDLTIALNEAETENAMTGIKLNKQRKMLNRQEAADAKEANDAAKERKKEREKLKEDELKKLADLEKEYKDSLLTSQQLELLNIRRKYEDQIKIAEKHKKDSTLLREAQKSEEQKINQKYADLELQKQKELNQKRIELEDKQFELKQSITLSEREKEENELLKKYESNYELAVGNAELQKLLDEKLKDDLFEIDKKYKEKKKTADEKSAADEIETRKKVRDANISMAQDGANILLDIGSLFAKNEADRQKLAKIGALTQIGIDTATAISSLMAVSEANPLNSVTFGSAGFAQWLSGIARITANVAKAKQALSSKGGSVSAGGSNNSSSPSIPQVQAPNFNIVGNAGANPLAQLGNAPLQAYVVSGEVTSAQSLDRNRIKSATL